MTTYIGSLADPTFCHLVTELTGRGIDGEVVDLAQLVLGGQLRLPLDGTAGELVTDHRIPLTLPVVARLVDLAPSAPDADLRARALGVGLALRHHLAAQPWRSVVNGSSDNSNFSKVLQLHLGADPAWSVPRSCLSNDPTVVAAFLDDLRRRGRTAIFKGASSAKTWASPVTAGDLERLPSVRRCPVLFQERIDGPDVRVHVVGDQVFGEVIRCDGTDYRTATRKAFAPQTVPDEVAAACVELTRSMRLVLCGIDFKISAAGRWYFLEANSAPCLQGYDRRAHGAITGALASHLRTIVAA